MKKVLIACEYSGVVRDAFLRAGYWAESVDLLPSESNILGVHHKADALQILNSTEWDLLIAHPPCKYLSYAGSRVWHAPGRAELRANALDFFARFINAKNAKRICVENPMGEPAKYFKNYQIIQPYFFGDNAQKRTLLWLKNLPPLHWYPKGTLFETETEKGDFITMPNGVSVPLWQYQARAHNGHKKAAHILAKTFKGVAEAMAIQWGGIL